MSAFLNLPRDGEGDHAQHGGGGPVQVSEPPPPASPVPLPVPGRIEGFTLVELMVVIVILGLLATIVLINVMPALSRGKATAALASVRELEIAIDTYQINQGRYPTREEGLQALVSSRTVKRLDPDPWGNAYVYRAPGRNGRAYDVMSLGADGREGGTGENADIVN
jgi:general secretion pathway protein G